MLEQLGTNYTEDGRLGFLVWAPLKRDLQVKIISPAEDTFRMKKRDDGYFEAVLEGIEPGSRYVYVIDGKLERPDPVSHFQPEGVHLPSEVVMHSAFKWKDSNWRGLRLEDYIIYELHAGTFTGEGTLDALRGRVPYLLELGVTAIELMPVGQFPGTRNWGYDGAYPFAVQNSYGGPEGLKRFVDECHGNGLAVILDVVYNHLGPEGNYIGDFAPYFTDRYRAPWGQAMNFDGPYNDGVRRFFIENAIHWFERYHVDALRIDAVHGMFDMSAKHFLQELQECVRDRIADRPTYLIPESDLNEVRLINPIEQGGYGLDAQWNDDYHHALHTLLTGEDTGYYMDFGELGHMAKAISEGFVYSGQHSKFRKRGHGSSTVERPPQQFVVFSQNHDQVGNRAQGDRLTTSLSTEQLKLACCMVILSPNLPLLFMGEEYAEKAPFQYFVSHSDHALVEAVRKGRKREFASFGWQDVPDPQDESTFLRSKINLERSHEGNHREMFDFYKTVIKLRKEFAPLHEVRREDMDVVEFERALLVSLPGMFYAANFDNDPVEIKIPEGRWQMLLDSTSGSMESASGNIQSLVRMNPYGFVFCAEEA
jgi:maltooligosyltrehalose trehalohydrolase